ncbi:unnamed protein product [Urochloa humidicola]
MAKGKGKVDGDGTSRERTINWDDGQTKFMLDWCIDYMKNQHAGFRFKKQHHMKCADALNKEFAMGVTVAQVDRHFRHYKENWKYVSKALNNSGNGFDSTRCMVTVSESEKANLNDRARRLLSKPIKFFYEMQELFMGTNADGSLATDQDTCMNDYDDSGSDDSQGLNDMSGYAAPEDLTGDDSDTLPSPMSHKVGGESSASTSQAGTKRPRGAKSPSKKSKKPKSRFAESTEQLNSTLVLLQKFLSAPAPQVPLPPNPHASLWERLEAMTITTDDKITIGQYLAHKDREGLRDFLSSSSDTTLQTWVYKFLTSENY